jgi:predicted O-linked N-acetylglucosamine transferase (SPINDLY family)
MGYTEQEEYVSITVALASDRARLAAIRAELRVFMRSSGVRDRPSLAGNLGAGLSVNGRGAPKPIKDNLEKVAGF